MKKMIVFLMLAAVLLSLSVTAFGAENKVPVLPEDVELAMKEAFVNTHIGYEVEELSVCYYGEYDGCYVGFIEGPWFYPADSWISEIAGYSFYYSWLRELDVYKDGELKKLTAAYEAGWLSDEAVGILWNYYTNGIYESPQTGDSATGSDVPVLPEAIEQAMTEAFVNTHIGYEVEELSVCYYGEYDGCYVGFIEGPWFYPADSWISEIAGYSFYYSWLRELDVYKDGELKKLTAAYEAGWLTDEAVGRLWNYYTNGIYENPKMGDSAAPVVAAITALLSASGLLLTVRKKREL